MNFWRTHSGVVYADRLKIAMLWRLWCLCFIHTFYSFWVRYFCSNTETIASLLSASKQDIFTDSIYVSTLCLLNSSNLNWL